MSASQPPPLNPLPPGPIGPVTVPRGTTTPKRVAIIVLAVVVLLGGLAFGASRLVRRPADFPPPPALPKVLADPVVTEAIDLFKKPKLGKPWNASGGAVPKGMEADAFVTPCGVLVTVVQHVDYMPSPQLPSEARVVGYDIASGTQKWSFGLQQATGMSQPYAYFNSSMYPVSYSGDCHMVLNFSEQEEPNKHAAASLFIDLATGDVATMKWTSKESGRCVAAGDQWAGCSSLTPKGRTQSTAVKLDGSTPLWTEPAELSEAMGDLVVAGFIQTDAGYREPATGRVVFGSDLASGPQAVVYVEPRRPGGYRSGLVVRFSGPMRESKGPCQITLWDPATNQPAWPTPQSIACGERSWPEWGVAGQALIVTNGDPLSDSQTTRAYGLAGGWMLWQHDGGRHSTEWGDRLAHMDRDSMGLSETYVFFTIETASGYDYLAIRIADGVETNLNVQRHLGGITWPLTAAAGVMAYDYGYSDLTAYAIDADKPDATPSKAWSIPLGSPLSVRSTFATGGVMYLLYDLRENGLQVAPLL